VIESSSLSLGSRLIRRRTQLRRRSPVSEETFTAPGSDPQRLVRNVDGSVSKSWMSWQLSIRPSSRLTSCPKAADPFATASHLLDASITANTTRQNSQFRIDLTLFCLLESIDLRRQSSHRVSDAESGMPQSIQRLLPLKSD
jgi:hypothetical protein